MADNYLEKRMDDLRAGRIAPRAATPANPSARPSEDTRELSGMGFILIGGASDAGERLAKVLRSNGATVDIADTSANAQEGNRIAQRLGCRFWPVTEGISIKQREAQIRASRPAGIRLISIDLSQNPAAELQSPAAE